jgi:hypothetical protein
MRFFYYRRLNLYPDFFVSSRVFRGNKCLSVSSYFRFKRQVRENAANTNKNRLRRLLMPQPKPLETGRNQCLLVSVTPVVETPPNTARRGCRYKGGRDLPPLRLQFQTLPVTVTATIRIANRNASFGDTIQNSLLDEHYFTTFSVRLRFAVFIFVRRSHTPPTFHLAALDQPAGDHNLSRSTPRWAAHCS